MIDNRFLPELHDYLNPKVHRYEIINYLAKKHHFVNYLEIGVYQGQNIRKVEIEHKDGVDPGNEGFIIPEVNYPITSDAFFELIKNHDIKYDIIFIDGLHHSYQVEKDINNSLNHIVDDGYIILHDCNPLNYDMQIIPRKTIVWTGDVWKSIINVQKNNSNVTIKVVDTDFGIGIVQKKTSTFNSEHITALSDWEYFVKNKKDILNLINTDEFFKLY